MNQREPIQAPRYTEARANSQTELARVVAAHHGWTIDEEDQVFAADHRVATSIEQLAQAMHRLGWFHQDGDRLTGVYWAPIPDDSTTAGQAVITAINP